MEGGGFTAAPPPKQLPGRFDVGRGTNVRTARGN